MSKNVLLGIVAFGGLVLVSLLLPDSSSDVTVNTESESTELVMPANIPNFPIYDATLTSVRDSDGEEARNISLTLQTEATKQDIHEWYRQALSQDGWSIKSDKNVAGYQIIQAENLNLYTSLQTANGEGGTVVITQHLKIRK